MPFLPAAPVTKPARRFFRVMVKEREMAEGKGLGRSDGRGGDREMSQANEAKAEKDLGERRGLRL